MGKLTRFGLVVFVIATILGTGMLTVLWFAWEPLLPMATWLVGMDWFNVALLVILGIIAVGLIVLLISAIATPGKESGLSLEREEGTVSITKDAIHSTAEHALESQNIKVDDLKVEVRGKRNPKISIRTKVEPGANANLTDLGQAIQQDIAYSVNTLTGYPVENVDVTFAGKPTRPSNIQNSSIRKEVPYVGYKRADKSIVGA